MRQVHGEKGTTLKRILTICAGILLTCLPLQVTSVHGQEESPVRALVIRDTGPAQHDIITQKMDELGWEVGWGAKAPEVIRDGAESLIGNWDVVWVPATTNYPAIRRLAEEGGPLKGFVESGGTVVVMGVKPLSFLLDIDPGGTDTDLFQGEGTVTITDPTHPMVTGEGIGGVPLTEEHFDPHSTGGNGYFLNVSSSSGAVVENASGPVVMDYLHGSGRIWIAATDRENPSCADNLLLYLDSLN